MQQQTVHRSKILTSKVPAIYRADPLFHPATQPKLPP